jgi:hypothetical protein
MLTTINSSVKLCPRSGTGPPAAPRERLVHPFYFAVTG